MTTHNAATHHVITTLVPDVRRTEPRFTAVVAAAIDAGIAFRAWTRARHDHRQALRDAAALRSYAQSIRHSEPSLASDLFAAADRAA